MPEFKRVVKVNEIKWEYSNKLYSLFLYLDLRLSPH